MKTKFNYYNNPKEIVDQKKIKIEPFEEIEAFNSPEWYTPSKGLVKAVNLAILLGKPLLITGEPGTGKTLLASSLSWQLHEGLEPFVFTAKTTSKARDLFYTYDAIQHFHDSNIKTINKEKNETPAQQLRPSENTITTKKELEINFKKYISPEYRKYIYFSALGKAIIQSHEDKTRYVVLIDEIDKAPRDFPNDLLMELENMVFRIDETNQEFRTEKKYMPIVIITSNSERLLPEPFLRRCVYFHIDFPNETLLKEILINRLERANINGTSSIPLLSNKRNLEEAIRLFFKIRNDLQLRKKPATAEFMFWMEFLIRQGFNPESFNADELGELEPADRDLLNLGNAILLKHQDDFKEFYEKFSDLKEIPNGDT